MNNQGIFQENILIISLIVLAGMLIISQSQVFSKQQTGQNIAETVEILANADTTRLVLDQATSKIMADAIISNGCTIPSDFKTELNTGYTTALIDTGQTMCNFGITSGQVSNNTDFDVQISCDNQNPAPTALNPKKFGQTVTFHKNAIITNTTPCEFTVTDTQSGVVEYTQ